MAAVLAAAAAALASPLCAAIGPAPAQFSQADLQFFETRVRPVLVERCYKCHSHDADKIKGGLMLDTREGMLHGGVMGPGGLTRQARGQPDPR